jgi:hypothetical protein
VDILSDPPFFFSFSSSPSGYPTLLFYRNGVSDKFAKHTAADFKELEEKCEGPGEGRRESVCERERERERGEREKGRDR